jgi:hypothetical protein
MYLPDLLRSGIAETLPTTGAMHDPSKEQACALGCIKISVDKARWQRILEHLAKTTICKHQLPSGVVFGEGTVMASFGGTPTLHLALTSLNDCTDMSREAIAEWFATLPDEKLNVGFGQDRESDPLTELQSA